MTARDPERPCPRSLHVPDVTQMRDHLDKDFLRSVLCVRPVGQHADRRLKTGRCNVSSEAAENIGGIVARQPVVEVAAD